MDEEIELTTVDGRTVRVTKSAALWALGNAMQHDAYGATTRDGNGFEVRRVHAHEESTPETLKGEDREVPPEIEEDAADVAKAVDVAVRRVLDRRADALKKAIRAITVDLPDDEPNGEAERQLLRLEAAVEHLTTWAPTNPAMARRLSMVSDAAAKLCAALADDTKKLREAAEAYFGGDFSKPDAPAEVSS